jgi:hypothetical protein
VPVIVRPGPIIVHTSPVILHTGGDTATTVIAAVGLVFALASVLWQAWTFRLSGSRVRVEIARGLIGNGHAITVPWDATPAQLEHMQGQGYTDPAYLVTVANSGRGETSVVSVDLALPGGGAFTETVLQPQLPFRLEGQSEQTWHFDGRVVEGYVRVFDKVLAADVPRTARGRVRLGGREKPILSKNQVEVQAGG